MKVIQGAADVRSCSDATWSIGALLVEADRVRGAIDEPRSAAEETEEEEGGAEEFLDLIPGLEECLTEIENEIAELRSELDSWEDEREED